MMSQKTVEDALDELFCFTDFGAEDFKCELERVAKTLKTSEERRTFFQKVREAKEKAGAGSTKKEEEEEEEEVGEVWKPELPSLQIQVINQNGEINPDFCKLLSEFDKENFKKIRVVSVMGPQAGGKSTLLNAVFNTKFKRASRLVQERTTEGLWISKCGHLQTPEQLLILDVEGVDSLERRNDRLIRTFERHATLFSLAISDVLIVNMWEHDVCREGASCTPLLDMVFSGMLHLSEATLSKKRVLMFVLRDHDRERPMEYMTEMIMGRVREQWTAVAKAENREDKRLLDVFDIIVCGVGNLLRCGDDLDLRKLGALPRYFFDKDYDGYVFRSRGREEDVFVCAADLANTAADLWKQIKADNELIDIDIPQKMIARAKCQHFYDKATADAGSKLDQLKAELHATKGAVDLVPKAMALIEEATKTFDQLAPRRDAEVHAELLASLRTQLARNVEDFRRQYLLAKEAAEQVRRAELEATRRQEAQRAAEVDRAKKEEGERQIAAKEKELERQKAEAREIERKNAEVLAEIKKKMDETKRNLEAKTQEAVDIQKRELEKSQQRVKDAIAPLNKRIDEEAAAKRTAESKAQYEASEKQKAEGDVKFWRGQYQSEATAKQSETTEKQQAEGKVKFWREQYQSEATAKQTETLAKQQAERDAKYWREQYNSEATARRDADSKAQFWREQYDKEAAARQTAESNSTYHYSLYTAEFESRQAVERELATAERDLRRADNSLSRVTNSLNRVKNKRK